MKYLRRGTDLEKLSIVAVAALLVAAFLIFHPLIHTKAVIPGEATYTSDAYKVTFQYPADWHPVSGYGAERSEGTGGFFEVSASGGTLDLGTLVGNEAQHVLHPYGSNPTVSYVTVAGKDAALIMPSSDQDDAMRHQAALIVTYPQPITLSGATYYYLVLWADMDHIQSISSTIQFLK